MHKHWVLVVEPLPNSGSSLGKALAQHEFQVDSCASSVAAQKLMSRTWYDALVLEWHLEDVSGIDFCRQLRAVGVEQPILFVTRHASGSAQIAAFRAGADDYFDKELDTPAIAERLRVRIRGKINVGGGESGRARTPTLTPPDVEVSLTRTEERILAALQSAQGRPVPMNHLASMVWRGTSVSRHTLHTHVSTLRRKLEAVGWSIVNVRALGYRVARRLEEPEFI